MSWIEPQTGRLLFASTQVKYANEFCGKDLIPAIAAVEGDNVVGKAVVDGGVKAAWFPWGGKEHYLTDGFKVLEGPVEPVWVGCKEVGRPPLFVAGKVKAQNEFCGKDLVPARAEVQGDTVVGKAIIDGASVHGWFPWGGKEHYLTEGFEVLAMPPGSWIPSDTTDGRKLLVAGQVKFANEFCGKNLIPAKAEVGGDNVLGKAVMEGGRHAWFPFGGKEYHLTDGFEVLSEPEWIDPSVTSGRRLVVAGKVKAANEFCGKDLIPAIAEVEGDNVVGKAIVSDGIKAAWFPWGGKEHYLTDGFQVLAL